MSGSNQEEGRQERKKREQREKIIQVAADLFNRQGFYHTTMEQIAEAADVSRKTLYNYFPVKEAIADVYLSQISVGLAEKNSEAVLQLPDTQSQLAAALTNAYGWVEEHPELTRVVLGYRMKKDDQVPMAERNQTGTQSIVEAILTRGQQNGEIRNDFPVELLLMFFDLLRGSLTWWWLKDPSQFDLPRAMENLVDLVLHGAGAKKNGN